jgi:hypothetical protein
VSEEVHYLLDEVIKLVLRYLELRAPSFPEDCVCIGSQHFRHGYPAIVPSVSVQECLKSNLSGSLEYYIGVEAVFNHVSVLTEEFNQLLDYLRRVKHFFDAHLLFVLVLL